MRLPYWFSCLLITLAATTQALASETRIETLQAPVGVEDETLVYSFPSAANRFSLAMIELGTADNTRAYGGALARVGQATYGVVVSRDEALLHQSSLGNDSLVNSWLATAAANGNANAILPVPERPIELFYSRGGATGFGWGVKITLASYLTDSKTTEGAVTRTKTKAEQLGVGLGASFGGTNRTELGLDFSLLGELSSVSGSGAAEVKNSYKEGNSFRLSARHTRGTDSKIYVAGSIDFRSPEVSADSGNVPESAEFSEQALGVEGGVVARRGRVMMIGALNLDYLNSSGPVILSGGVGNTGVAVPSILTQPNDDVDVTSTVLAAKLATEIPIGEHYGFRGGMRFVLAGNTTTEDNISTGKPKSEVSATDTEDAELWSLGAFYHRARFKLDASVEKAFFHNAPHLISGTGTGNLFYRLSLSHQI